MKCSVGIFLLLLSFTLLLGLCTRQMLRDTVLKRGWKMALLRCLEMLWQFIVQVVSCSQTTAIKSTAYSGEESPIWLMHKMTIRFYFVTFLGCISHSQTKSYRFCSAFVAALELINMIFFLVINEWILICSFHQIVCRIFQNLFIGRSNLMYKI